jgi:signal transduction histidine kinase
MQQGGIIFNPESTRLLSIINESKHPLMDSADKKGVEIKYEIPSNLEVFADEYMLASTIRNLASNAVKFTRKGGKVTIAAKPGPGHSVEISVRDTGIGMSPQMVADLFRLDVISNRKGTDNEPSSGLGLLLCKEFIEKHGGRIWVESEEGKGSTFYFTLPSAPPPNR